MSATDILEQSIGMPVEKLLKRYEKGGWSVIEDRLSRANAKKLLEAIVGHYKATPPPVSRPSLLTPVLYDSEWNYGSFHMGIGVPPPRTGASLDHIRHTLMYAHTIYVEDPLVIVLSFYERGHEFSRGVLLSTLRKLVAIRPLVDQNIVNLFWSPRTNSNGFEDLVTKATEDPAFILYLRSIGVWGENRRGRNSPLTDRVYARAAAQDGLFRSLLEGAWAMEMVGGHGLAWVRDMNRAGHMFGAVRADNWFPSTKHAQFYAGLELYKDKNKLSPTFLGPSEVTSLIELHIPSLIKLELKELVALRRSSNTFEEWRQRLSGVLSTADDRRVNDGLREDLAAEMQFYANELRSRLKQKRSSVLTGGLRTFGLATAGIGGGALIASPDDLPSAVLGAAVPAAGEMLYNLKKDRIERRSLIAGRRHALILSENEAES